MKTVKNKWDGLIRWGNRRLPCIFLETRYLSGKKIKLPKWITPKQWDEVNKKVEDWQKNIKWE